MSAELIATVAVGVPAAAAAIAAFALSRNESRTKALRQTIADLLAPVLERLADVEEDVQEMKRNDRPKP